MLLLVFAPVLLLIHPARSVIQPQPAGGVQIPRPQAIGRPVVQAKFLKSAIESAIDVKKAPIAKAAIPKPASDQPEPKQAQQPQPKQPQQPKQQQQPALFTSQGYVVRIMKSLPTAGSKPPAIAKDAIKSSAAAEPQPKQPTAAAPSSSVYVVKRPESTVYQVAPPRPTTTMAAPKPITEITPTPPNPSNKPTPRPTNNNTTTKRPQADDADSDDEEESATSMGKKGGAMTTVQSGDPWGDFVFPTRGPRPNWMSSGATGSVSVRRHIVLGLSLMAAVLLI